MDIPYTYLVKCIPENKFYYGVKFGRGCNPDQFWKTYMTSSKIVKRKIKEYGKDAFTFEIRRTFDSKQDAVEWEHRVLKRLSAGRRNDFYNLTDGVNFVSGRELGYTHTEETRAKMRSSAMGHTRTRGPRNHKTYIVEGKTYRIIDDIRIAFGLNHVSTVHHRLTTNNERWADWTYAS